MRITIRSTLQPEREFERCQAATLLAGVAGHPDDEACGSTPDYRLLIYRRDPKHMHRAERFHYVCGDCLGAVIEVLRDDRCVHITREGYTCGYGREEHGEGAEGRDHAFKSS